MVFAGAGFSTETSAVFPWAFYDEIHDILGSAKEDNQVFPKLTSLFCRRATRSIWQVPRWDPPPSAFTPHGPPTITTK